MEIVPGFYRRADVLGELVSIQVTFSACLAHEGIRNISVQRAAAEAAGRAQEAPQAAVIAVDGGDYFCRGGCLIPGVVTIITVPPASSWLAR